MGLGNPFTENWGEDQLEENSGEDVRNHFKVKHSQEGTVLEIKAGKINPGLVVSPAPRKGFLKNKIQLIKNEEGCLL